MSVLGTSSPARPEPALLPSPTSASTSSVVMRSFTGEPQNGVKPPKIGVSHP